MPGGGRDGRIPMCHVSGVLSHVMVCVYVHVGRSVSRSMLGVCGSVIVRCAICGYVDVVRIKHDWIKHPRGTPQVWICDIHYREIVA